VHTHEHGLAVGDIAGDEGEMAGVRSREGEAAELSMVGRQPCFAQPPDSPGAHGDHGEILGKIDVVPEVPISHDAKAKPESFGFGRAAAEGAGPVGEPEVGRCRDGQHRRAVITVTRDGGHHRPVAIGCQA